MLDPRVSKTIEYYEVNALAYAEQTRDVDMHHVYSAFLPLIPKEGKILDVGCGAGRDLRYFRNHGYEAEGIEPASNLAEIAGKYSGAPVQNLRVEQLDVREQYDGIWASASLLHVPREVLPDTLRRLILALKPRGVLYVCFKKGLADRVADDGRLFNDQTCRSLTDIVAAFANAEVLRCWESPDQLGSRDSLMWTNMLLRRQPTRG